MKRKNNEIGGRVLSSFILLGAVFVLLTVMGSCIKDDIPYPRIAQNIRALVAEGELRPTILDSVTCQADVYLSESVDIMAVRFSEYVITEGGTSDPNLLEGIYDLSSPLEVTLKRYQEYPWKVIGHQEIERYFEVEGQVGESVIDVVARRVIVSVTNRVDLSKVRIVNAKLGAANVSETVPDLRPGWDIDLSHPFKVVVTAFGRSEVWTIYAEVVESLANTTSVDAWSEVIWAYGTCPEDMTGGFEYRESGSEEWITLDQKYVSQTGGSFYAYIPHLTPLTEYSVRAVVPTQKGNEIKVTTAGTADIPDGDFDQWWKDGNVWNPYPEGGDQFWDTGNTGAATLGQSNVVPTDHTVTGTGQAAQLETRFVGLFGLGKLAAGSIYTGKFVEVDGSNGILDFGRPWTLRPTRLKGYYQYSAADINYADKQLDFMKGQPDTCHIYVALTDWAGPFEIRTNPAKRQLFDPNSPSVIGYGELIYSGKMSEYKEFVIDIKYRDTAKVPTYLLITCAASKYGDYFTGGAGSILYVDQFSFDWDYPEGMSPLKLLSGKNHIQSRNSKAQYKK